MWRQLDTAHASEPQLNDRWSNGSMLSNSQYKKISVVGEERLGAVSDSWKSYHNPAFQCCNRHLRQLVYNEKKGVGLTVLCFSVLGYWPAASGSLARQHQGRSIWKRKLLSHSGLEAQN